METKIITISDTHNQHRKINVPNGDIIIHAGDFSMRGTKEEITDFIDWYSELPHTYKILIAGNHDKGTDPDQNKTKYKGLSILFEEKCSKKGIILLNNSDCVVKTNNNLDLKIWGSPVSPSFGAGWAWNRDRGQDIRKHWNQIPSDIDILVTHGPPENYLDKTFFGYNAGCSDLYKSLLKTKPKLHVFGHIHEARGMLRHKTENIVLVNTCSVDFEYKLREFPFYSFVWEDLSDQK